MTALSFSLHHTNPNHIIQYPKFNHYLVPKTHLLALSIKINLVHPRVNFIVHKDAQNKQVHRL